MIPRACDIVSPCKEAADTITLDETARHRRRVRMTSDNGIAFVLDLAQTRLLRHGDGLLLDDGRIIEVRAAPEALYAVRAPGAAELLTLAWHIGNRHLPAEILTDHILIRRDHVIREMLEGLGATVTEVEASFSPARGAYDHRHDAGHSHDHP